ncbi:MAG: N-acetyltransferase [Caulobacter sp.]|nr:N-acetyltransferase [Caulobacter sp.]
MLDFDIRPFQLADGPAVNALCDWAWWPQRSQTGWKWLADGPPGARDASDPGPAGWVCEQSGEVRAFLGNFVQRFHFGTEVLRGASGHTFLALPSARGAGRTLLRQLAEQQGRFAIYLFNANAISASRYVHHGLNPWPEATHQVKYSWWVDLPGVVSERLLWKLSELRGFDGVRAGGERFITERLRTGQIAGTLPGVRVLDEIDDRFDDLWARLQGDGRLLAARDAASLRWRLSDPELTRRPVILGYETGGRLAGYLLAFFAKQTEIERPSLDIVDLIATREAEPEAIPALVQTLVDNTRLLGAVRVRLQTVSPRLDELLIGLPGARRTQTHGHCHARFAEGLSAEAINAWHATPYDGDYSFCLRPPPLTNAKAA